MDTYRKTSKQMKDTTKKLIADLDRYTGGLYARTNLSNFNLLSAVCLNKKQLIKSIRRMEKGIGEQN